MWIHKSSPHSREMVASVINSLLRTSGASIKEALAELWWHQRKGFDLVFRPDNLVRHEEFTFEIPASASISSHGEAIRAVFCNFNLVLRHLKANSNHKENVATATKATKKEKRLRYVYLTSSFRWSSKSDGWKYRCLIWLTYFTSIIFIFHFIVTVRAWV